MDGATTRYSWLRASVIFLVILQECLSLEITRLTVPSFVQNGSEESVLLDCEYTYNLKEDKKLVVKWFHEDDPNPVYQWIPEFDAKLHSEKFRVNEDYLVPAGNEYTRSRALNIQRPTTELSGKYSCQVQSLEGSDTREDHMVVYALPSSVNLNYTIHSGIVRVACEVDDVFPLPEMSLFKVEPGEVDPTPIDEEELDYELEDGAYNVELSTNITERELASDGLTFFGCSVVLNGTKYEKTIQVPYFPDPVAEKQEGDDSDDDGASEHAAVTALVASLVSLLFLLT
ncbi:uncharacterized protein LOC129221219 [Uloborus diversus]|uniref:uncharacterized protein LOC129221219 n=1 Tax=Uloborus diversus TaxID=327109 RepID=UPI002409E287|nr:uncharacterized protein LOC129221219 [Uloborus diversus]